VPGEGLEVPYRLAALSEEREAQVRGRGSGWKGSPARLRSGL
jgi:hypothetical protein